MSAVGWSDSWQMLGTPAGVQLWDLALNTAVPLANLIKFAFFPLPSGKRFPYMMVTQVLHVGAPKKILISRKCCSD